MSNIIQPDVVLQSTTPQINSTLSNLGIRGYSAYDLAVQHGFVGTEDEWILSLRGEEIELKETDGKFYWKYSKHTEWNPLYDMSEIVQRVTREANRSNAQANRAEQQARNASDSATLAVQKASAASSSATSASKSAKEASEDREAVEALAEEFSTVTAPGAVQDVRNAGVDEVSRVTNKGSEIREELTVLGLQKITAINTAGTTQTSKVASEGTKQVGFVTNAGEEKLSAINLTGAAQVQAVQDKGEETLDSIPDDYTTLQTEVDNLINNGTQFASCAYDEDGFLHFYDEAGEDAIDPVYIPGHGGGGGGGGGGDNNAILTVTNAKDWLSKIVSEGGEVEVGVNWSSLEDDIPTGNGTLTVRVNNSVKLTKDVAQGLQNVDVSSFLGTGTNKVRVSVSDAYNNTKSIIYTVKVVNLYVTSAFDSSKTYPINTAIDFAYIPVGAVEKTVHFVIDGTDVAQVTVSESGRQKTQSLPTFTTHGAHTLNVYFEATIDGTLVRSNELYYSIMVVDEESLAPIISSAFRGNSVAQYATLVIPYYVYTPNNFNSKIELYANGEKLSELTVDRTEQIWSYRPDVIGALTLKIVCGTVEREFSLTVTESDIDVEAETDALALYLTSYGRSNAEENPATWTYDGISATMTNFNFTSDGWLMDKDGNTVLRVTGDARVAIPYQIFARDFRSTGKTIEFDFATSDVRNYDALLISCWSDNRGIQITPQSVTLKSANAEIGTQFKDNEHVRVSFVVEKRTEHRLVYCYINGVMSAVIQYIADDDFSQQTPVNISIGSNDATIDLYNIRIYDNDLTRHQILNNWIADTQSIDLMLNRYNHNNVYDEYSQIVISKLPTDLPYLTIVGAELPQSKGDKKTVSGSYTDPMNPSNSFTFDGAQIDVQGTSSQYYARKNYKIKFKNGFVINGETVKKYALRGDANSIPTNTFTFKADVASSEGANNVELARLYNDICPYQTPAQGEDDRIRQGIDGFPIVIFWDNGDTTTFLGKYNFNNDKGTEEVFGFVDGDESWEIKNNTSDRVVWKSDDYTGTDWLNDFEARYPDTDPPYADPTQLAAMATWIKSTENDVAKFKAELADHMEVDSVLFYYLFTELFLMVDSRAKNAFPSFMGGEI